MKRNYYLLILFLILQSNLGFAQVGKICNWKDDKTAAVVMSFDDWSPGQYPIVVPALNARGLTATFFPETSLIASWNHDWPTVVATASAGNEIGNHTVNHPHLNAQTAAQLNTEITGAKNTINANITSQKVVSFAYPFGEFNAAVLDTIKAGGHICARTVLPPSGVYYTYDFATTVDDYYNLRTFPMNGSITTAAFTAQIQNVINGGGLLTYLYHSIDNAAGSYGDNWFAKVLEDSLKRQMDTLLAKQNKIWVTTFAASVKYHKEKRCATLSEVQAPNGSLWIVDLTDTLSNNTLYNQPITIKLKMNSVGYNNVTQNGNPLIYTLIGDTIMFNAVPDGGQIALTVGTPPINLTPTLNALSDLSITQLDGVQTVQLSGISAGGSESQNLTITISTDNTALIQNIALSYTSPNIVGSFAFTPNVSASGTATIMVRVTDNGVPSSYVEQSFTVSVSGVTALNEGAKLTSQGLTVSPNPTSGAFAVEALIPLNNVSLSVESSAGNIIYENSYSTSENIHLDLTGKTPGVYFIRIKSDQGYIVKKIIVL